jgi:hypothetical protein
MLDPSGSVNRSHNQIRYSGVSDGIAIVIFNLSIDCFVGKVKAADCRNAID